MSIVLPSHPVPTAHPGSEPLPLHLLADIAKGLAAAQDLWRPHVHHDREERPSVRLLAADRYEAWLLGWTPGQHVELHDHGDSAGALTVIEGELVDVRATRGLFVHQTLAAGSTTELPAGLVHDVVGSGPAATTSIHVYSPPLTQMSFYDERGLARVRTVQVVPELPVTDLRDVSRALHPAHRARTGG
jgi:predicted metal-dependent enzyme (double-stranded beta helix superfamily)